MLRHCATLLRDITTDVAFKVEVPRLLFEDRENYLYAMSAAPADHVVWKHELLSGVARQRRRLRLRHVAGNAACKVVARCRRWRGSSTTGSFSIDLRLDPYYRQIAGVHESLAPDIERLIDSVWSERHCLVHGDFSPKNLLVYGDRLDADRL